MGFAAIGRIAEARAGGLRASSVEYDPVEASTIVRGRCAVVAASLSIVGLRTAGVSAANAGEGVVETVSLAWPVGDLSGETSSIAPKEPNRAAMKSPAARSGAFQRNARTLAFGGLGSK